MKRSLIQRGAYGALLVAALTIGAPGTALAQDAALIKKGQAIYAAQKCSVCHAIAGKGAKTNPLDGVGAKLSAADTRAWITDPVGMASKAGSTKKPPMPAKYSSLSAGDLDALVAYMQSLK
jgi:mono/diheme cytochrome c family protein